MILSLTPLLDNRPATEKQRAITQPEVTGDFSAEARVATTEKLREDTQIRLGRGPDISSQISDYLKEQQRNGLLTAEQVKNYRQVLTSPEFQDALATRTNDGKSMTQVLQTLLSEQTQFNPGVVEAFRGRYPNNTAEAVRTELLTNVLDKIATQGFTNQGTKNTCALAASERVAFANNQAEVTNMVVSLATTGTYKSANNSVPFTLDASLLGRDREHKIFPERTVFEQVFQESSALWLNKISGGDTNLYNPNTTTSTYGGVKVTGTFAIQQDLLMETLTGHKYLTLSRDRDANMVSKTMAALPSLNLENGNVTGYDPAQAVGVHMKWAPDSGAHAKHSLLALGTVTKDGKEYVVLANSHYERGFGPGKGVIEEINRSKEGAIHDRLELIPVAEFQRRLVESHIQDGPLDGSRTTNEQVRLAVQGIIQSAGENQIDHIHVTVPANYEIGGKTSHSSSRTRPLQELMVKDPDSTEFVTELTSGISETSAPTTDIAMSARLQQQSSFKTRITSTSASDDQGIVKSTISKTLFGNTDTPERSLFRPEPKSGAKSE